MSNEENIEIFNGLSKEELTEIVKIILDNIDDANSALVSGFLSLIGVIIGSIISFLVSKHSRKIELSIQYQEKCSDKALTCIPILNKLGDHKVPTLSTSETNDSINLGNWLNSIYQMKDARLLNWRFVSESGIDQVAHSFIEAAIARGQLEPHKKDFSKSQLQKDWKYLWKYHETS